MSWRERVLRTLVLWALFASAYTIAFTSPYEPLVEALVKVAAVTLVVAIALSEFLPFNPYKAIDPRRVALFVILNARFLLAMATSHLKIAKAILDPRSQISAAIVPVRVYGSEYTLAALAHLITSTPGTAVVDFEKKGPEGILHVHWLNPEALSDDVAKREIVGWMEDYVRRIID
ncbi:MAG: Na+/H+ antiporter subunit E [Acidilobaceae archaeon]